MKTLENEIELISLKNNLIILTNLRVIVNYIELGKSFSNCIFLENISSIELKARDQWYLFLIGVALILSSSFFNNGISQVIAGFIILIVWWITRKQGLKITPNGGAAIFFIAEGADLKDVTRLHDAICDAKLARVNKMHN